MQKEEANKVLSERLGMCWHEHEDGVVWRPCKKCGWQIETINDEGCNKDFFTAQACFDILWPWMRDDSKHPGWTWQEFHEKSKIGERYYRGSTTVTPTYSIMIGLIDHYRDEGGFVDLSAEWCAMQKEPK